MNKPFSEMSVEDVMRYKISTSKIRDDIRLDILGNHFSPSVADNTFVVHGKLGDYIVALKGDDMFDDAVIVQGKSHKYRTVQKWTI
jgi:hypothetical protein